MILGSYNIHKAKFIHSKPLYIVFEKETKQYIEIISHVKIRTFQKYFICATCMYLLLCIILFINGCLTNLYLLI